MTNPAFQDAFNLLCGEKLGSGIHRDVFECRLRPDLVVKVEQEREWRRFANVLEIEFWHRFQDYKPVADWLAPCEYLSPDGRILLQKKVRVASELDELPEKLPGFLTDIKPENYGWLEGRLVCLDYAIVLDNPKVRPRSVNWN